MRTVLLATALCFAAEAVCAEPRPLGNPALAFETLWLRAAAVKAEGHRLMCNWVVFETHRGEVYTHRAAKPCPSE